MELKPSYKQTEVGMIPKDWEVRSLTELLDFRNGVNAEQRAYGTGIPFINVLEVINNSHLHESDIPGRVSIPRCAVGSYAVRRGDLLFNRTSETQEELALSSVYLDKATVLFGGFVIRGRPTSAVLDPTYSGYAFRSPFIRKQIVAKGQGAIRANIGQADLRQVRVPLPPLSEQYAIAEALSDADDLIRALDRLIAKKRDLKQAAMQELLTGKTRLPGFSGEWEDVTLGRLGSFSKGRGITREDMVEYGLPCIRYGEIYTRHKDYVREFYSFVRPEVARESQRLYTGDLLFTGSGETAEEIGKCVAFLGNEDAYAGGDIVIFSPLGQDPMFLGYLMNHATIAEQKSRMGQGDAVVHISARSLASLRLKRPNLAEQKAIAAAFADMDAELAAMEQRRDKTSDLKKGMMQELLTGRTRLI